ncbi:hypothetical protein M378DRAFT_165777, partial [Amanita muscaria Koide BX008]
MSAQRAFVALRLDSCETLVTYTGTHEPGHRACVDPHRKISLHGRSVGSPDSVVHYRCVGICVLTASSSASTI